MMHVDSILSIRHFSLAFTRPSGGDMPILTDIHTDLTRGLCYGIVGESGSGKTMLGLSLLGLLPDIPCNQTGEIWYQSPGKQPVKLQDIPKSVWHTFRGAGISMVFQEPLSALNPILRCGLQVSESIQKHQGLTPVQAKECTLDWFTRLQIADAERVFESFPHELSGGQRQRVVMATALANAPSLVVADEPTTALDTITQYEILQLIQELRQALGLTILFISHDMAVISQVADEVMVMCKGQLVEQGITRSVLTNPQHAYTRMLLQARSKLTTPLDTSAYSEHKNPPILDVRNLSKQYETTVALADVSFLLHKGETLGVVGGSGSGKTTLAKIVTGIELPDAGDMVFKNRSWQPQRQRDTAVQIVFQDPFSSLNPKRTVLATLREALQQANKLRSTTALLPATLEGVRTLLERVELDETHLNRLPSELSGGQRQRISLARALAFNPDVLVCDEAFSALDSHTQVEIAQLIRSCQQQTQMSILFITHDISLVSHLCHRVLVMQGGKIVEQGKTSNVLTKPAHVYTRTLLGAVPTMPVL